MVKQAARNATKTKGVVTKKKNVTKAKQKKEQDQHHASSSSSSSSSPSIGSKFVGVSWIQRDKKWKATIRIDGKQKHLGYFDDEKEAACKYDEQAALLNKPVNFPQHEGQEQAAKPRKDRSKLPDVMRQSKFVGVSWYKKNKKWLARIRIDGKQKHLGYFDDEKEAACKYDEQAALLNKPVNFPQHEGQQQAVNPAPRGSGPHFERDRKYKMKSRATSSTDDDDESDDDDDNSEDEWNSDEAYDDDDDDDDDYLEEEDDDMIIAEQEHVADAAGPDAEADVAAAAVEQEEGATPPADLYCPITKELFVDPVLAEDGETYERSAIEECLRVKQAALDDAIKELQDTDGKSERAIRIIATGITSPMGHGRLESPKLTPNRSMKRLADEWR